MNDISITRLTAPKTTNREIARQKLIDKVLNSQKKFVYIHAGAGYGKTTLLSQIATLGGNTVWLSLAGENDIFTFVDTLCKAIQQNFVSYKFISSEYLPFIGRDNFVNIIANSLISSIEKIPENFIVILDDLHTVKSSQIKKLISCLMKYIPGNIQICMASREALWQELIPFYLKGCILELSQNELAFTTEEATQALGFNDEYIYSITEGWPLAIGSFRVLLENGVSPTDIHSRGNEALYSYLLYECISRLPSDMVSFLKTSAFFEELDATMLDEVLDIKNTRLILENLVSQNIFTIKTGSGDYRYHALFREGLLETGDPSQGILLQRKAAKYYWDKKEFLKAAEYAIILDDKKLLQNIILACYQDLMKTGNYNKLRVWFQALGDDNISTPEILLAKGAFLSSIGNFTHAKICLDEAIPMLKKDNEELYIEAAVHKARVLRNFVSFEASNELLDKLMEKLYDLDSETAYSIVIEKLYNYCWNSQVNEAYDLALQMIENCARVGNLKVRAWFERYLCAINFFAGRMKDSVYYYEKSLELPDNELQYLDMHGIGIYAAKAYQMLGDRNRALTILIDEIKKMRMTGKYEEMWSGYLFAAEIHFQNTAIDRTNGKSATYETTMKYFTLADEYAPLYRKTDFQLHWAKMQRLTYSLMFTNGPQEDIVNKIYINLDKAGDYLKSIILARLFGYFAAVCDFPNSVKCAKLCIEVGENSNMLLHSTLAYGVLARAAIVARDQKESEYYTTRYLRLCSDNGIYEYFRAHKDYDPILEFAFINGIEPDITKQIAEFSGYKTKKVYIQTFGGLAVFPYNSRERLLKMRTKKERELLAFLLDAGVQGVSKDQIYEAVWSESESDNVKQLIGVNLTQIKKDLATLSIENAVVCHEKLYSICRDEIECDMDLFEDATEKFKLQSSNEEAQRILSLYKGEFLSDFEALWATAKRIKYRESFEEAVKYCLHNE